MTRTIPRWAALPAAALYLLVSAGCGALDVSDPTAIEDGELTDAEGALLLRADALRRWYIAIGQGVAASGLVADEFFSDPPSYLAAGSFGEEMLDRRQSLLYEQTFDASELYRQWQEARRAATLAMPRLRTYGADAADAYVGEMFAVRGFASLRMAEDYCPGFPLHDVVGQTPVYGPPLSTDEAFERALADFDSAVVYAADSARILNLGRVGRARTLLGLGRFAEAGAAVTGVPTSFVLNAEYASASFDQWNLVGAAGQLMWFGQIVRAVSDVEGGTGLDFVAAVDPRVPLNPAGPATDGVTPLYDPAKYPSESAPIVLASDIEARLIAAEAALRGGGDWLGILNALRTTCTDAAMCPSPAPAGGGGVAGLPPLSDPGIADAQVNLLFRERAFWLFGTGHRLGDLRRLIRHYGRAAASVFPAGPYRLGGVYETATSIPFPGTLETPYNPAVTGCTSR